MAHGDAHGMPVRVFVTSGTTADCKLGEKLIAGTPALALLADRGYDFNSIIDLAGSMEMEVVIPPKKNRKIHRDYENTFSKFAILSKMLFWLLFKFAVLLFG